MIPLLGGYAWVNTVGSEKCRKRASSTSEFKSQTKCSRCKRYLQNESRRAYLQNVTGDFLFFIPGLSYDLSKFTGLEKSFLCQSQNFLECHFSGRIFFHLGRNRAPRLESLGAKKKKEAILRSSSAHIQAKKKKKEKKERKKRKRNH